MQLILRVIDSSFMLGVFFCSFTNLFLVNIRGACMPLLACAILIVNFNLQEIKYCACNGIRIYYLFLQSIKIYPLSVNSEFCK